MGWDRQWPWRMSVVLAVVHYNFYKVRIKVELNPGFRILEVALAVYCIHAASMRCGQ
jgi:hypothetical protein